MVCPRQSVVCCLTLAIIMINARQIESRSNAGNDSFHVSCIPARWVLAQTTCNNKQGAMFELDDLKQSYGLPILEAALLDVGEMWIRRKRNGGCMKAVKLKQTTRTSSGSGDPRSSNADNVFLDTNCTELHHYVCKLSTDSEPHYVPCQSHPAASRSGFIYLTVLGVGLVLLLSSIATYILVRRLRRNGDRMTDDHSNSVQNPNGTQSDNPETRELQTQDKHNGHPVERGDDLCSLDTDNSAFLGETLDTYDDPADLSDDSADLSDDSADLSDDSADLSDDSAGLSDDSESHSEGHTHHTPNSPEDDMLFISPTYDNVTYLCGE